MNRLNAEGRKNGERGGVAFAFVLLLLLPFVAVFGMAFVTTVLTATAMEQGVDVPGEALTSSPLEAPPAPAEAIPIGDLGTGGLVEVRLPNVYYPKVPALDRRIAPLLRGTMKAMAADGINNVTFSYMFRSSAQQAAIVPVGTTMKARPGTSSHEAGLAVDVEGMRRRSDAGKIVEHFRRSGFKWLGPSDAAHFYIPEHMVGEPSRGAAVKKAQADYESGKWRTR